MIQRVKDTAAFQMLKWALHQTLRFSGRATRREFLIVLLCTMVIGWTFFKITIGFEENIDRSFSIFLGFVIFLYLVFSPLYCTAVRRLHDSSRESGAVIWTVFIPWVGWLVLIILLLWNGDNGPNGYGPDPRAGRER